MWGITLKGVVAHRLRYALTALAVLLGVAFIAGTFVLTDTMNSTFNGLYEQIDSGTAAVVRATQPFDPGLSWTAERQRIDASLAGTVAAVPGVRAVAPDITGYAQLVGKNGKPIGMASNGPPTLGTAWTDVADLNPLRLLPGGQPPRAPGQVVIDKHSADVGHFKVGDTVRIELVSTDVVHGLYVDGYGVSVKADPGQTKTLTFTFDGTGPFAFACHATGHYEAGMHGTISVVG